ncbi:MAG: DNA replication/repair protein RecF [Propionibacteriaceae bacterium]|jgi:DNA replication and repair protein RecF|nr:DNA replication/repair protein RecF [Propionibacteriaceae bacterium]
MYLSRLALTDFRSYDSVDLDLGPGVIVFLGPNGYGKTNIVEAVEYLATGSSHRVATDAPLIRSGAASATISAKVYAGVDDERSLTVDLELRTGMVNKARLNRAAVRPRDIIGAVRVVSFAPEDLSVVRGDPSARRAFLDDLVIERSPRLAGPKAEYERTLKQKTALLKAMSGRSVRSAGAGAEETLDVWDEALVRAGAELVAARLRTVADIEGYVASNYDAIAPSPSRAVLRYESKSLAEGISPEVGVIAEALAQRMTERREDEITRGVCLVGPHRDDLSLSLGDLPVKGYASHGEGWSYTLALRLASLDLLHADGLEPVLILDDVFAELDERRRERVVAAMDSVEQTFITAAVLRDVPENLDARVYKVEPGVVHPGVPLRQWEEQAVPVAGSSDHGAGYTEGRE